MSLHCSETRMQGVTTTVQLAVLITVEKIKLVPIGVLPLAMTVLEETLVVAR